MGNDTPYYPGRYKQLSEKIEELFALPPPVPAEKHLLREQILELELRRLDTIKHLTDEQMMQLAVDFTLAKVPQNVSSYPMAKRETVMPVKVGVLEGDPAEPRRGKTLKLRLEEMLAVWRSADSP